MDTIIWGPTKKESSSMKTTRRKFLKASAAASAAGILPTPAGGTPNGDTLDAYQIAQRHLIVRDLPTPDFFERSEEHTSELQSRLHLVCRLLLEKKKTKTRRP